MKSLKIFIKWLYILVLNVLTVIVPTALVTNVAKANSNPKEVLLLPTSAKQLLPSRLWVYRPSYAIKSNALFDLTASLNLGAEVRLSRKLTMDMSFTLNPWTIDREKNSKFKFALVQPELRYWSFKPFQEHFFGVHALYAYYNAGNLLLSESLEQYRFEGQLAGVGISYGYNWSISSRWIFEGVIGLGYARLWYDKFPCQSCAKLISSEKKNYFGVTRAGINFIYILL